MAGRTHGPRNGWTGLDQSLIDDRKPCGCAGGQFEYLRITSSSSGNDARQLGLGTAGWHGMHGSRLVETQSVICRSRAARSFACMVGSRADMSTYRLMWMPGSSLVLSAFSREPCPAVDTVLIFVCSLCFLSFFEAEMCGEGNKEPPTGHSACAMRDAYDGDDISHHEHRRGQALGHPAPHLLLFFLLSSSPALLQPSSMSRSCSADSMAFFSWAPCRATQIALCPQYHFRPPNHTPYHLPPSIVCRLSKKQSK